jgi:hypothetical protein
MRKLNFLAILFFVFAIGFTGCKKESAEPAISAKADILGKWSVTKAIAKIYDPAKGEYVLDNQGADKVEIEFKADGTLITYEADTSQNGKYIISDDGKTINILITEKGTTENEAFQIKQLSKTDLVLYQEIPQKYTSEITFKKIP